MVLFVHTTPNKNVKDIIKDGEIKSYSKTKIVGIGEESYNIMTHEAVFCTVLFDYFKVAIPNYTKNTYLFFDKSILTTNKSSHYCNIWEFGKITKQCIKYTKSKSVDDNIESWSKSYKLNKDVTQFPNKYIYGPQVNFDGVGNEIIFKDSVNFSSLVGIYSYDAKWKHPLLITTQKELKIFLNKYGIEDIDTTPKKHYYIPFYLDWTEEKHNQVKNKWLDWAYKQNYTSYELKKWKQHYNSGKTRKNTRNNRKTQKQKNY